MELFDAEKERQLALLTRVEKIEVRHKGVPEECTLIMNKDLSTPFNCAMRELFSLKLVTSVDYFASKLA